MKTCKSVGDPHIHPFVTATFDNHDIGWKTLYTKGDLMIQANQQIWLTTRNVAVNAAVRYTTNARGDLSAASTWQEPHGQTLENPMKAPIPTSAAKFSDPSTTRGKLIEENIIEFPDNHLTLQVVASDWRKLSNVHPDLGFSYDIWVTTNDYDGAKGQCVDGEAGQNAVMVRLRRSLEDSDGVPFPKDVKVTKTKAKEACAAISDPGLKENCVTDIRMVNDPEFVDKVVSGFKNVEAVDKSILDRLNPNYTNPIVTTPVVNVACHTITGLGLTVLTIIGLSM